MEKLSLREIAEMTDGIAVGECVISNISIDSRTCTVENTLYVAIIGERFDGHIFSASAVENGAVAILVSQKPKDDSVPYVLVENTETALIRLAEHYIEKLSLTKIAVTGSVGKTTTKEMIYHVLSKRFKTLKTEGNLNNQIGLPKTVLRLDRSYSAAVLELGMSDFGEISLLSKTVKPDIAVITLIGVSHIETLGSKEGILKAKLEILDGMKKDSPIFIPADDELLSKAEIKGFKVIKFGIHNKSADFLATDIEEFGMETSFKVVFNGNSQTIIIPTLGIHNVYNALSTFAVGIHCGIPPQTIALGLYDYKPSGMRQNIVRKGGVTIIEDCYNASPDSMNAAIDALMKVDAKGKKIAVFGDMLELGSISQEAHYQVGKRAAEEQIDIVFCFGEESKNIKKGAQDFKVKEVHHFDDKDKLMKKLLEKVTQGDAVLFKASRGIKMEETIEFLYETL